MHAQAAQQFLRQNTADFIAADEWASYAVFKSTGPQRGNQKLLRVFENPLHNGKKTDCG